MAAVYIGTSGWHYAHWRGPFYPVDMPARQFLAHYARRFGTVEINNSFYQLPSEAALREWMNTVPSGFIFAVKANRFITHMKKLKDAGASSRRFFDRVAALREKLGPILFQLPPRWRCNPSRLEQFLSVLPANHRYAFELRDPSWFHPEVEAVLREHGAAFCIYELGGLRSPKPVTADFVYVRLHGPEGAYQGRYGRRGLGPWASDIRSWRAEGKDVYCYFDNDQAGYAVEDASLLEELVAGGCGGTRRG